MPTIRRLIIEGPYTTAERDALVGMPDYYIILNSSSSLFEYWDPVAAAWRTVPGNSPTFGGLTVGNTTTSLGSVFHNYARMGGTDTATFSTIQGTDVASANDLSLTTAGTKGGNVFEITGTTQINAMKTLVGLIAQQGMVVTLLFTSTPTVKHNTAGGADTIPFILAGAVDFVASAGATLTVVRAEIGGTDAWRELSRTLPAATQTYSASNVTTDRAYDANATSIDELADVLGSLIADLRAKGVVA